MGDFNWIPSGKTSDPIMKIAFLILAIGLAVVAAKPNEANRSGPVKLPCGGVLADIESCTCDSGDVVRAAATAAATVCLFGFGGKPAQAKMGQWPPEGNTLPFATFAAGCFWGVELRFQRIPGVDKTAVGYIQGKLDNPTYEMVCSGMTGHTEAVQMTYDPNVVTFAELCDVFYEGHNPRQLNGQGGDMGTQYRSGIYYHDEEQKKVAEEKKAAVSGAVTEIQEAEKFWPAEEYHQQYLEKGGRFGSGQNAAKGCTDKIRCYG